MALLLQALALAPLKVLMEVQGTSVPTAEVLDSVEVIIMDAEALVTMVIMVDVEALVTMDAVVSVDAVPMTIQA